MDKSIGSRAWVLLKGDKEYTGIFRGLDDYWNMVLDDVKQIDIRDGKRTITELDSILLNGNNIVMFVPGGNPVYSS